MKKISIVTLGCKVNQYESEEIAEQLEHDGYETTMGLVPADIYVVNTFNEICEMIDFDLHLKSEGVFIDA